MKLTYDPRYNVAYLRLQEKRDGMVYGIELLNANEQLWKQDKGRLIVVNEALGDQQEKHFDELRYALEFWPGQDTAADVQAMPMRIRTVVVGLLPLLEW